jgi:hypothetical protein
MIFGIRGKTVKGPIITMKPCSSCDCCTFLAHGVLKYFHLYWIPMFIISKKVGVQCTQCNQGLTHAQIPKIVSNKIKHTIFNKKNTTPFFAGPIILFALIMFIVISIQLGKINETKYLNNPMVNDIYIVDLNKINRSTGEQHQYGAMRVLNIFLAKVEFQVSASGHNSSSEVSDDIRSQQASEYTYYDSKLLYLSKEQLPEMKTSNAILSIKRNY